jgi:hypothetical protein
MGYVIFGYLASFATFAAYITWLTTTERRLRATRK